MKINQGRWRLALLLLPALVSSCAHRARPISLGTICSDAGAKLRQSWTALSEAVNTPGGCEGQAANTCDALRFNIGRLLQDCPGNPDVLMANALLAFERRDFVTAQQYLDQLNQIQPDNPEAAIMRARIALDQGNLPFALRFLDQQIRHTGDHAGLRETHASALFAAGRWQQTREELRLARQLGAPAWRIAFALGLLCEAEGNLDDALVYHREALEARPGWRQPESRMRAIEAVKAVKQQK